ncbi:MAG: hypothetical protein H6819_07990 [Phycisphaerales bacterium]|nr:hypothetical protein [Phycisphaerales bacterium]MCB9854284.1 hypothetical protein [Phycisphaerales bacterium]MCB9863485.1 hypothetical protein [Phycisphaerales bacterium]
MIDRFHIAVAVPQPPTRAVIEHVSKAIGLSSYDARLRLLSVFPRSLAFRSDAAGAMELAQQLQHADLARIVYREADLPPKPPFSAFRLGRIDDGLIFEDKRGEQVSMSRTEISLVVMGTKTTATMESSIEYSECNYRHGPRGSRSPITVNQVRRRRHQHATFITFFRHESAAQPVRIVTDVFDFLCLGRQRGLSDGSNALKLIEMIDAAMVGVATDRRLLEAPIRAAAIPHNRRTSPDVEHAVSYLIRWEYLARRHSDMIFNATGSSNDTPV